MNDKNAIQQAGLMSDVDIKNAINNNEMLITPFNIEEPDEKLTPSGFNFSFTKFIISRNKKIFYEICENEKELYFDLEPGDTALALTKESIWVSKSIGGTFHSKVKYVAEGLGHISTTLDPGWQGQLLISVNNPSKKCKKIVIAKKEENNIKYKTFITLYLYRLISPTLSDSDNTDSRLVDINSILQSAKNKDQKNLCKIIANMLIDISSQKVPNLNNSINIKKDIEKYKERHQKMLDSLEKENSLIKNTSKKIIWQKRRWFVFIVIVLVFFVSLLFMGILNFSNDDNVKWLITFYTTLIGVPTVNLIYNKLKDKIL